MSEVAGNGAAEDALYAHLEYLIARVEEYEDDLSGLPHGEYAWQATKYTLDGFQMCKWTLEDEMLQRGLPLERKVDGNG